MAQFLRAATPMEDWRSLKFIVDESGGKYHGRLYLVQETVGMIFIGEPIIDPDTCCEAAEQAYQFGDTAVLIYHAEKIMLPKLTGSGEAFLPGDKVYWSGVYGTGVSPNPQSGWYWIGICTEPADEDEEEVEVDLKGDKATLLE